MRLKSGMSVLTNGLRRRVAMSLAFGLIWSSAALGNRPLFPGAIYPAGEEPRSVAIGDLDGDQLPDLAVANRDSDNVSVLRGVGDGTFAAPAHYAAGDGPTSLAIGDLDGDQVLDLVVTTIRTVPTLDGNVSVLLGLGDGTFAAVVHYAVGRDPRSIAIGDLDGDQV
ncbi:MAG: VCBS repeat-containing protein, partial [Planctomycetes bacterium]|nr:VCBS repeat-containing protein [Planctomycetota bacterium]